MTEPAIDDRSGPAVPLPSWVVLRCPDCGRGLRTDGARAVCEAGHRFEVVHGIPQLFPRSVSRPDPAYIEWVGRYYRRRFSEQQEAKTRRLVDEFFGFTRPEPPVLDVGCGRADKSVRFPPGVYVGIDPIDPIAAGVLTRVPAPMVCGVGENLPFSDAQFASVLLFGVLDHVADRPAVYRECARVLRPKGTLCVLNQAISERRRGFLPILGWVARRLLRGDLRGLLAVAEFTILSPATRRYTRSHTLADLVAALQGHFTDVRARTIEDGHVALIRAVKA